MHVVIFGASGLIACHLRRHLLSKGAHLTSVFRKLDRQSAFVERERQVSWEQIEAEGLPSCDALLALTGAPIFDRSWTEPYKRELIGSRCGALRRIGQLIRVSCHPPKQIIAAGAIGIYPPNTETVWRESAMKCTLHGKGFLQRLCRLWENEADRLNALVPSVTRLRLANVLTPDGGMLGQLIPWFKRGLGAQIGDGNQMMSWIHIFDVCNAIQKVLLHPLPGPLNLSAPEAIEQKTFAQQLAAALHARIHLRIPIQLLHFILGERASLLTDSCAVQPRRLLDAGYGFVHPLFNSALSACCSLKCKSITDIETRSSAGVTDELSPPLSTPFTFPKDGDLPSLTCAKTSKALLTPKSEVIAHLDCGYGNALFIRGGGGELSWKKGVALENLGADLWRWISDSSIEKCHYKILFNDQLFEKGENRLLNKGQSTHIKPVFE